MSKETYYSVKRDLLQCQARYLGMKGLLASLRERERETLSNVSVLVHLLHKSHCTEYF